MAALLFQQQVTNAGGTFSFDPQSWGGGNAILYLYTSAPVTLSADINIALSSNLNLGATFCIIQSASDITRNGRRLSIVPPSGGYDYTDNWQFLTSSMAIVQRVDTSVYVTNIIWDLATGNGVSGDDALSDGSTPPDKMQLAEGAMIVGDSSGIGSSLSIGASARILQSNGTTAVWNAITGVLAITNGGVTTFVAGSIANADINAAAAIARTKIANGTASHVVINDGSGTFSSEAQLAASRGGLGLNTAALTGVPTVSGGTWSVAAQLAASRGGTNLDSSASTGVPKVVGGTWSIQARTETIVVPVSWESGEQCNNRVQFSFDCTITNIYAVVTKALANTDAGTIVPKDGSGTNMTLASALSFPLSSALETAIDTAVTANNTVVAGDEIYLTTAKTTAGGKALVTITFTRLT